jgi:hypothetical protein
MNLKSLFAIVMIAVLAVACGPQKVQSDGTLVLHAGKPDGFWLTSKNTPEVVLKLPKDATVTILWADGVSWEQSGNTITLSLLDNEDIGGIKFVIPECPNDGCPVLIPWRTVKP